MTYLYTPTTRFSIVTYPGRAPVFVLSEVPRVSGCRKEHNSSDLAKREWKTVLGENIVKAIIGKSLDKMREVETLKTLKTPSLTGNFSWLQIARTAENAKHGQPVIEPYGSNRDFIDFADLMFVPAQIATLPVDGYGEVTTATTIGSRAGSR